MSTWQFQTRQFLLPKSGYELSECEDAIGLNAKNLRFAIADGATEAFDAQSWARQLASKWVALETAALTTEQFHTWVAEEGQALHDSWSAHDLSWYAKEKSQTGSFAAFVGVQLEIECEEPCWRAIALGDSCLIHSRDDSILSSLPLSNHTSFTANPLLVPSNSAMQEAAIKQMVLGCGRIEDGDKILLLSDAAAAWYLMLVQCGDSTRFCFERSLTAGHDDLCQLFNDERLAGRIKDDDIAVLSIEVKSR